MRCCEEGEHLAMLYHARHSLSWWNDVDILWTVLTWFHGDRLGCRLALKYHEGFFFSRKFRRKEVMRLYKKSNVRNGLIETQQMEKVELVLIVLLTSSQIGWKKILSLVNMEKSAVESQQRLETVCSISFWYLTFEIKTDFNCVESFFFFDS